MKRNAGIIGPERLISVTEASGIFDLHDCIIARNDNDWPKISDLEYTISNSGTSFTLRSTGTVNYTVDWGDGSSSETSTSNTLAHTYSSSGTYVVKINSNSGTYRPKFDNSTDEDQITSIAIGSEDSTEFSTNIEKAFRGAQNMTKYNQVSAATSAVTDFERTWNNCSGLTSFPLINTSSGTIFTYTWMNCSGLTEFPLLNFSSATSVFGTWSGCSGITTFPTIDTSSSTSFGSTWNGCSGLTTFPQIDTSSGTNFKTTWNGCSGLTTFPQIDTSSGTNFRDAWKSCSGLTSFPALDFSNVTNIFTRTWSGCSGITTFPSIDVSNCPGFNDTWKNCTSLTTYPANQFNNTGILTTTSFTNTWNNCALNAQSIENILTSLDTNGASNIILGINGGQNANASTWSTDAIIAYRNLDNKGWTIVQNGTPSMSDLEYTISNSGTSFTLRSIGTVNYTVDWGDGSSSETSTSNTLAHTYSSSGTYVVKINSNSGATYRPKFDSSGDEGQITSIAIGSEDSTEFSTNIERAFRGAQNMTKYNQVGAASSTVNNFGRAWQGCSGITTFPLIDITSATSFNATWAQCSGLTQFPVLDFSSATNITAAWIDCTGLTSFPTIDTSSVTNFNNTWRSCSGITTFPVLDTSSGTGFSQTWKGCSGLTTFPVLDTSSGTNFNNNWSVCSGITTFPSLDFSSGTSFQGTWRDSTSLTTYPANQFNTTGILTTSAFTNTWNNCALNAQSIENILTSLDTNGASNITLGIDGGQNANASTWSYDALTAYINLHNKGWTISKNGDAPVVTLKIDTTKLSNNTNNEFVLRSFSTVNFDVDWGDGNYDTNQTSNAVTHNYASPGTYVIKTSGVFRPLVGAGGITNDPVQVISVAVGAENSAALNNQYTYAFQDSSNLVDYNSIANAFSAVPDFRNAWASCTSLTTFPANVFDTTGTLASNAFYQTFVNCALTAQSIENILTSLDTNGQSNILLSLNGGTNAGKTTWSTAANTAYNNLVTKGWTISFNS